MVRRRRLSESVDIKKARPGMGRALRALQSKRGLEVDAAGVLNFPAVIAARYPGAASHGAAADAHIRIAGHERVGHVIELHAQFELHPLGDLEVLHDRRVKLPETRTAGSIVVPR